MTCQSITVFRGTLTIRALVMGDGALCYGALEIVGLLLLLLLLLLLPELSVRQQPLTFQPQNRVTTHADQKSRCGR